MRVGVVATRPRTVTPELALRVDIKTRTSEHTFWKSLTSLSGMNVFAVFVLAVRIKLTSNFLLGCFWWNYRWLFLVRFCFRSLFNILLLFKLLFLILIVPSLRSLRFLNYSFRLTLLLKNYTWTTLTKQKRFFLWLFQRIRADSNFWNQLTFLYFLSRLLDLLLILNRSRFFLYKLTRLINLVNYFHPIQNILTEIWLVLSNTCEGKNDGLLSKNCIDQLSGVFSLLSDPIDVLFDFRYRKRIKKKTVNMLFKLSDYFRRILRAQRR